MVDMERDTTGQSGVTILRPSDMQPISSASAKPASTKLRYVLSPGPTPWSMLLADRNERFRVLQPGQRLEVSPEAWAAARRMAELVAGREGSKKREDGTLDEDVEKSRLEGECVGGAALIVDYGDEKAFGGSFRVSAVQLSVANGQALMRGYPFCRRSRSIRSSTRCRTRARQTSLPTSTLRTSSRPLLRQTVSLLLLSHPLFPPSLSALSSASLTSLSIAQPPPTARCSNPTSCRP